MGTIVTFPPPRRKRSSATTTTNQATILLFMGVRYVREFETAESDTATANVPPERIVECAPLETA